MTSTRYLHRDHLGSVTHLTNETGAVVDTFAYDAWGARRNPSNWTDYSTQPPPPALRRPTFTGHETLHDVGIVHMNGRIYDPKLGRVLSADPHVQFAGDAQSYNRYSYALNNPLLYTDPSGFMAERLCFLASCGAAGSARVGAIGSGSSRPQIGVTTTIQFGGFGWSGGLDLGFHNAGWGPGTTCPSGFLCQSGEPLPTNSVDIFWWMSAPSAPGPTVTHTPYAGIIADDAGVSSGGAIATNTIAASEQNWVGPTFGYQRMLVSRAEGMVYEFSNWLDGVQTKLDFLSIGLDASIVGSSVSWIPDAANTGISVMRGDWLGTGLGAAAAIPYLGTTGNLTRIGIRQAHHVIPMFLGGIKRGDGVLSRITKEAHDGFHQILRARLKARGIDLPIGGVDGSTLAWADYFRANPGGQWNAFMAVLEASRLTDAAYGTTLVRDFWLGIAKGNYTSIP